MSRRGEPGQTDLGSFGDVSGSKEPTPQWGLEQLGHVRGQERHPVALRMPLSRNAPLAASRALADRPR